MKTVRLLGVWVCLLLGLAIANLALRTPRPCRPTRPPTSSRPPAP